MSRLLKTALAVALFTAVAAAPAEARWRVFGSSSSAPKAVSTHQLLKHAKQALAPGGGKTDLTPILREIATRLPGLRGSERTQAQRLLLRPTDGGSDPQGDGYDRAEATPVCSAHFCVHYVPSGDDAPAAGDGNSNGVPDFVETARNAAETSYNVENVQLGWRTAKSDGDGKTDIYMKQLGGTGIYGYAVPDPGQNPGADNSVYAYLVIDNDFKASEFPSYDSPDTPLQVTVAHEYNHILQYTYDFLQDTWMLESTAVWMEGKVFPAAFDYLQYLDAWVQLTGLPLTAFNGSDPNDRDNLKVYGTAVWNKWLDTRYGSDVVRRAWEVSLDTPRPSFAVGAYDQAIRDKGGSSFADEFSRFSAATAEWQAQGSGFPEGSVYPEVARAGTAAVNGAGGTIELDHTTYGLVNVGPSSVARAKLSMRAPSGTSAALALVGRVGGLPGSQPTVEVKLLPHGGSGNLVIENPSRFSRLTAVLVNADSRVIGSSEFTGDWIYGRDGQTVYARMSTDFTAPRVTGRSPGSGARRVARGKRVTVKFSERVLGVSRKALRLVAPSGRVVGARVKFTAGARSATLTPKRKLGANRRYRVEVTTAVTDTALNPLARTATWSFVTGK
ncbi:MAG: hypothetical protein QOH76_2140 [Thermoleophilaceae bacterium]|jgi:hypothetical protein|nr:hypothetical protein [Thermoleophilaceae bacterium]